MKLFTTPSLIPIRTVGTLALPVGGPLLRFLIDEWGAVHFENENVIFNMLLTPSKETTVQMCMRLMGTIAEAAFVQRCIDSKDANRIWLEVAGVEVSSSRIEYCIPIGTSLSQTKKKYIEYYYPSHPQLDIMWLNNLTGNAVLREINTSDVPSGKVAGLQLKTRLDSSSVYDDLKNSKYKVPVVYFDINNDYDILIEKIKKNNLNITDGKEILSPKKIDESLYKQVVDMTYILFGIIEQKIDPSFLLKEEKILKILNSSAEKELLGWNNYDSVLDSREY